MNTFLELAQATDCEKKNSSIVTQEITNSFSFAHIPPIKYTKHDFVYCEMTRGCNGLISHYKWRDPVDTRQVLLPHRYTTDSWEAPDIRLVELSDGSTKVTEAEPSELSEHEITKLAYDCCLIMDKRFNYTSRNFYMGSFFQLPIHFPRVQKYIEKLTENYKFSQEIVDDNRGIGSLLVIEAIGIELSIQLYREHKRIKDNLAVLLEKYPKDIVQYGIQPYLLAFPEKVPSLYDYCDSSLDAQEWTHDVLYEFPLAWSIYFEYSDKEGIYYECTSKIEYIKDHLNFVNFSTYDSKIDPNIGIFVNHEDVPLSETNEYPVKMKLLFHLADNTDVVFYSTPFVDCPDYYIHEDVITTLDRIEWAHDA